MGEEREERGVRKGKQFGFVSLTQINRLKIHSQEQKKKGEVGCLAKDVEKKLKQR